MKLIPVPTRKHLYFTVVDDWLYDLLSRFKWYALPDARTGKVYVAATNPDDYTKQFRMSRLILGLTNPKIQADHANRNTLDNRCCNLRVATHAQNLQNQPPNRRNKSGYKGVYHDADGWHARITADHITNYLGTFPTPEDAARAYDTEATQVHGEFAYINFPTKKGRK